MAVEWFCQLMGAELGPMTTEQLVDMARHHKLTPEDLVRRDASPWVPAFRVKGLFEAAAKPAPPPAPVPKSPPPRPKSAPIEHVDRSGFDAAHELAQGAGASGGPHGSQDDWFCIAGGEKQGPMSLSKLQQLADSGQLRPADRVWRGSAPKWSQAMEVAELKLKNLHFKEI